VNSPATNNAGCGDWPTINGQELVSAGAAGYWDITPNNAGSESITYDLRLSLNGMGALADDAFTVVSRPSGSTDRCAWVGDGSIPDAGEPGRTLASGYAIRTGLTSFSQKAIATSQNNNPFPVELQQFTATPQPNGTVVLRWATLQERNSASFRIERALQPSAGFSPLLSVSAAGHSHAYRSYEALDETPLMGRSYYRLVQIDLDGTAYPLNIVEVNHADSPNDAFGTDLALYPNPLRAQQTLTVSLQLTEAQTVELRLLDFLGRSVWTAQYASEPGTQSFQFAVPQLPTGVYYLQANTPAQQHSRKLVITE
jgi:hypothetical protein